MELAYVHSGAWDVLAQAYLDHQGINDRDVCEVDDREWEAWLHQDPAHHAFACVRIGAWLQGTDLGRDDFERAMENGHTAQSAAHDFWEVWGQDFRPLPVVVVDGEHPGSTYFAAELRCPVEEANRLAAAHGIPIRFAGVG